MKQREPSSTWLEENLAMALAPELQIDIAKSRQIARSIVARLSQSIGAGTVYVPSSLQLRAEQIRQDFTGANARDVAALHGVSLRTVYRHVHPKK